MKASFLHIMVSLLFAGIFLFAGTGYNMVQYCCRNCEAAGVEMMVKMPRCCAHKHHPADNTHQACCNTSEPVQPHADAENCLCDLGKGCQVERIAVDVPSIQAPSKGLVDYQLIYSVLDILFTSKSFLAGAEPEKEQLHTPPKIPIARTGRQILSQISILII